MARYISDSTASPAALTPCNTLTISVILSGRRSVTLLPTGSASSTILTYLQTARQRAITAPYNCNLYALTTDQNPQPMTDYDKITHPRPDTVLVRGGPDGPGTDPGNT